jgi:hypothetical protein
MRKEVFVDRFHVLSLNLSGESEKNYVKPQDSHLNLGSFEYELEC